MRATWQLGFILNLLSSQVSSFFRICFARNSLISRWRGMGCETPVFGFRNHHDFRRGAREDNLLPPTCGPSQFASSDRQLGDSTDAWYLTAREVPVKIPKILLKFTERFALSQVIREFLEVAEPHITVLPMDVTSSPHNIILLLVILLLVQFLRGLCE
jgi:hypothetical protein